jgi:hypothetical protein
MPVWILDDTSTVFPMYLKVVSALKLRRVLYSAWYARQRNFLKSNDIALMLNTTNHPQVRFYNQDVRFEVVYKRFSINQQHLYIPMEDYAKYYIDYKMRMAASVAEMLGVIMLKYRYNEVINELSAWETQGGYAEATVGIKMTQQHSDNKSHADVKVYDKGTCQFLFASPEEFEQRLKDINCYFIDSATYDSDYDLRNLVRARLVGNLTDYSLKYEVAYMSKFELKVAARLYGTFGTALKRQSRRKLCVTLDIQFYRMEDLITTDNMNINDNRCLQLILRGPSPPAFYDKVQELAKIGALLNNGRDNDNVSINIAPAPTMECKSNTTDMVYNFIERHLMQRYVQVDDRDDSASYVAYYTFLKIADRQLLATYIQGIKSLDDLAPDGFLAVSLRSTVFAALLPFDDDGYYKLQQIYVQTLRQFRGVEQSGPMACFNLRCSEPHCDSPLRYLKRIFVYIMRTFNHENPETPLTVALETNERFARVMYNIATNIIVIPSYALFAAFATQCLQPFLMFDSDAEEPIDVRRMARTEGVRELYTTPPGTPVQCRRRSID